MTISAPAAAGARPGAATATTMVAYRGGGHQRRPDQLVTEEPMEIKVGGPGQEPFPVSVTMRTPGHDFELAVGFLLAEGLLGPLGQSRGPGPVMAPGDAVRAVRYCDLGQDQPQRYNVVTVSLAHPVDPGQVRRNFAATASCGVCGTATLEQLELRCRPVADGPVVPISTLASLPDALRDGQRLFERTGGLHAAGLARLDGGLEAVREDVGRHNALDKLIGRSVLAGELPLGRHIVVLSGRISYELVQKAASAGIAILVAVGAPTSLAVATAERLGVTTLGFVRAGRANVYSHPERVDWAG